MCYNPFVSVFLKKILVKTLKAQILTEEYGASKILCDIIKEKGLENIFLAVTRIHNGPNLAKKRFELISSAARKVIDMYTNVY